MFSIQLDNISPPRQFGMLPNALSLSLPFHVISGGDCHMGDGYSVKRDGLDNYLLFLTLDGEGYLEQGGTRIAMRPREAALIHCVPYQAYGTAASKTWHFFFLHFNVLSMTGYRSTLLEPLSPAVLSHPQNTLQRLEKLLETAADPDDTARAVQSDLISGILTDLVCAKATQRQPLTPRHDIASLCGFIEAHYREDLHIEDFMRETHLSKHYLIHLFEQEIGLSPYRYLHTCRIKQACSLLLNTDRSVEEIAYRVGYHSPAVFIRHFKAIHAVTPNAYRQITT